MDHPFRPMMIAGALFLAAGAAVGLVGAAHAGTAPPAVDLPSYAVSSAGVPTPPMPDLANPLDPQARPKLVADALNSEVFAKTSVDHHFGEGEGGPTVSAGVLCGRQPGHGDSGGAAAYGIDPHGRFVGAKLSFAF